MPAIKCCAALLLIPIVVRAQSGKLRPDATPTEDPELRARAVALVDKGNALSSPVWPMNEGTYHFRFQAPGPGESAEGTLVISVAAPWKKRWHYTFGAFELDQVRVQAEVAQSVTGSEPATLNLVRKILPVYLLHFNEEDLIRQIQPETVDGTPAQCIYFDTIFGDQQKSGKICVDAVNGFILYSQTGETIVHQSQYYRFNNGYLPGHFERWTGTRKIADVDARVVVKTSFPEGYFDQPINAVIRHDCPSFQPAVAQDTKQLPAKSYSDNVIEIVVHGRIDNTGHPVDLRAIDPTHAELAAEAVKVVSTWTYQPAQCEYKPATQMTDFLVQFKGWQ